MWKIDGVASEDAAQMPRKMNDISGGTLHEVITPIVHGRAMAVTPSLDIHIGRSQGSLNR